MNFGGLHKFQDTNAKTGLTLSLLGFNRKNFQITEVNGCVALLNRNDDLVAGWSFPKLMEHWNRKHNKAVYVPSKSRVADGHIQQYMYGNKIRLCENTDFLKFLCAIVNQEIYYDPGIKVVGLVTGKHRSKTRNQLRIHVRNIPDLYINQQIIDLDSNTQ